MDHKGFTYLEMLIVLLVVSILIIFPINMLDTDSKNTVNEYELFKENYNYYRTLVYDNENCKISINRSSYSISCDTLYYQVNTSNITFSTNYAGNVITFSDKGNVSRAGTIVVKGSGFSKSLTVSVMSGSIIEK